MTALESLRGRPLVNDAGEVDPEACALSRRCTALAAGELAAAEAAGDAATMAACLAALGAFADRACDSSRRVRRALSALEDPSLLLAVDAAHGECALVNAGLALDPARAAARARTTEAVSLLLADMRLLEREF